jgi:hypothetical protein
METEFGFLMKILVTGATGYVGSKLIPELVKAGHQTTCMVRNRSRLGEQALVGARLVQADALDANSLLPALDNIDVAYYLIHSMAGGKLDSQPVIGTLRATLPGQRNRRECSASFTWVACRLILPGHPHISRAATKPEQYCANLARR